MTSSIQPIIRETDQGDLDVIVDIHIKAFPGFFLTNLGRGFLHELYKGFLHSDLGINLVIENEGKIHGFVAGVLDPATFFKQLCIKRGIYFFHHAFKALIKQPIIVGKRLISALKYRGESPPKIHDSALLSSLAIDPAMQGSGFGGSLIESFCNNAFSRNAKAVYLITDTNENDMANFFYLKNGFILDNVIKKTNGRVMNRYIKFRNEKTI